MSRITAAASLIAASYNARVAEHASEFGADGSRIAIAGNSVGGNMTAALTLMSKERKGPKISYQVLFVPATDASVDTASYHEFATGRFLPRAFMKYGWDLYAPDEKTRNSGARSAPTFTTVLETQVTST